MTPRRLPIEPLTRARFQPFGEVIAADAEMAAIPINYGHARRFADLARIDTAERGGRTMLSLFRSRPVTFPFRLQVLEHHPLSSQAFIPLSGRPFLVVVAPPGRLDPAALRAFFVRPDQGVNIARGVWHHFNLALEQESDFLVIDRAGPEPDLVEARLTEAIEIAPPLDTRTPEQSGGGHGA